MSSGRLEEEPIFCSAWPVGFYVTKDKSPMSSLVVELTCPRHCSADSHMFLSC